MEEFATYYAPEYEENGQRKVTTWRQGGIPGAPSIDESPPDKAPNWFIGEDYLDLNYSPQMLVFARASSPVQSAPTPMIGWHRTGYRQFSAAIYTIQTRIWAFNDTDGQELFNFLAAAAYVQLLSSTQDSSWESLAYMPKYISKRGVVMEFGMRIGVPLFLPPKAVARAEAINQRTATCHPKSDT